MDERLKKRLIGAAVLASLAVIFVPMLVEKRSPPTSNELALPQLPLQPPPRPAPVEPPLLRREVPAPEPIPEDSVQPLEEPEQQVAAPRPVAPPPPLSAWVVRVGSFSNLENATKLVEKLQEGGLETMDPQRVELDGRVLYRVLVGPELDRERAQALLPRIREISRLDGQVRSYP